MSETPASTASLQTPNLNKALSLLQGDMPKVKKTKTAEVKDQQTNRLLYKYDYADLGDVVADMGPLMARHGLAFHCAPTIDPANRGQMILAWSLLHESGEERSGEWPLGPVNQKPQSLGSAITYGRRYSFTAATNIVLEDDDDGQRAQQDHGSRQSAADAFENAAPAPPRQNGSEDEAEKWLAAAIQQAPKHATIEACTAVWQKSAAMVRDGTLAKPDAAKLQGLLLKRVEKLKAAPPVAAGLDPDDPWALKVEEIPEGDIAAAAAVLDEATEMLASGAMDAAHFARIEDAITAKFPVAAAEGKAAA